MKEHRDRIFALLGAVLFLVTASSLTIAVIYTAATSKNTDQQPDTTQQATCVDTQTEPTLDKPASFKVSGDVTKLQTTDLEPGSGATIKSGDCVALKYYGTLAQTGKEFDENFSKPTALLYNYDTPGIITGLNDGLKGMKVGGIRRVVIPSDQAYGKTGQGAIPPNADLVFVVKLLRIQK